MGLAMPMTFQHVLRQMVCGLCHKSDDGYRSHDDIKAMLVAYYLIG
jgi:hypothetical protein